MTTPPPPAAMTFGLAIIKVILLMGMVLLFWCIFIEVFRAVTTWPPPRPNGRKPRWLVRLEDDERARVAGLALLPPYPPGDSPPSSPV